MEDPGHTRAVGPVLRAVPFVYPPDCSDILPDGRQGHLLRSLREVGGHQLLAGGQRIGAALLTKRFEEAPLRLADTARRRPPVFIGELADALNVLESGASGQFGEAL